MGAYGLDVIFRFETPGGLAGDSFQAVGLLVTTEGEPAILPATGRRFICPREFRPRLVAGGTRAQRALTEATLDRVTASYAPAIRISTPPRDWRPRSGWAPCAT